MVGWMNLGVTKQRQEQERGAESYDEGCSEKVGVGVGSFMVR